MPTYTVTAPDGKDYSIDGPEGASREEVITAIQSRMGETADTSTTPRVGDAAWLERKRELDAIIADEEPGFLENVGAGFGSGFTGFVESAALGAATLLDEEKELATRRVIQDIAKDWTPEGGDKDSIIYNLSSGLGSVAGFAAPAVLAAAAIPSAAPAALTTGVGLGIGSLLGVGTQAGEASERARAAGVSEDVRNQAIRRASPVGLTEALPFTRAFKAFKIPQLNKMIDTFGKTEIKGLASRIRSAFITGGAEAAQEVSQEFVQNAVERGYNPDRDLADNLGPSAGYGAGAGAIVQGLVDLFVPGKTRKINAKDAAAADEEVNEILRIPYDPYEQITMPDGSTMDVPKDDANRLAALETQKVAQATEETRQTESAQQLDTILAGQGVDQQRAAVIAPQVEQMRKEGVEAEQEVVMDATGDQQRDLDPQGLITALEEDVAEPIIDSYKTKKGKTITLAYTPAAATEMAAQKIDKTELPIGSGTGRNGSYTKADIIKMVKAKAVPKIEESPQTDMIDTAEAEQVVELDVQAEAEVSDKAETAAIEQMIEDDTATATATAAIRDKNALIEDVAVSDELVAEQTKERSVAERGAVLTNTLENNKGSTPVATLRNFSKMLEAAKYRETQATPEEIAAIKQAHEPKPAQLPPTPTPAEAAAQTKQGMQDRADAPKFAAATEEMEKKYGTVTDEMLTELGVPERAGNELRKAIAKDRTNSSVIETQLSLFAANPAVSSTTRENIHTFLTREESANVGTETTGNRVGVESGTTNVGSDTNAGINTTGDGVSIESNPSNNNTGTSISPVEATSEIVSKPNIGSVEQSGEDINTTRTGEGVQPSSLGGARADQGTVPLQPMFTTEAKKLVDAEGSGVTQADFKALEGSGRNGKYTKADVTKIIKERKKAKAEAAVEPVVKTTPDEKTKVGDYLEIEEVADNNWAFGTVDTDGVFNGIDEGFTSKEQAVEEAKAFRSRSLTSAFGKRPASGKEKIEAAVQKATEKLKVATAAVQKENNAENRKREADAFEDVGRAVIEDKPEGGAIEQDEPTPPASDKKKKTKPKTKEVTEEVTEEEKKTKPKTKPKKPLSVQAQKALDEARVELEKAQNTSDSNKFFSKDWNYDYEISSDPSTVTDTQITTRLLTKLNSLIQEIIKGKHRNSLTKGESAAVYFHKKGRMIDAIVDMVHDNVFNTIDMNTNSEISSQQQEYFKGSNRKNAKKAMDWVRKNLSPELNAAMDKQVEKATKALEIAKNTDTTRFGLISTPDATVAEQQQAAEASEEAEAKQTSTILQAFEDKNAVRLEGRTLTEEEVAAYNETDQSEETRAKAQAATVSKFKKELNEADRKTNESTNEEIQAAVDKNNSEYASKVFDSLNIVGNAISALDMPIHPMAQSALENGDLKTALDIVATTSANPLLRRFASALSKNIGKTKVEVVDSLENENSSASFSPKDNTIRITRAKADSTQVLLHEAMHAVVSHTLAEKKSLSLTKQLTKLYNETKDQLGTYYGSQSLDEFLSEAVSNPSFQQELASIFADKNSDVRVWTKFVNAIRNFFRVLMGKPKNIGTVADFNNAMEALMSPAPETRFAADLNILASSANGVYDSLKMMVDGYYEGGRAANDLPLNKIVDGIVSAFKASIPTKVKETFYGFMSSHMMAQISENYGVKGTGGIHALLEILEGDISRGQGRLDHDILPIEKWGESNPEGVKIFNWLTHDSTRHGVDPSKPKSTYKGDKLKIWKAYQKPWNSNEFGPEGRKHYNNLRDIYAGLYNEMLENIHHKVDGLVGEESVAKTLKAQVFDKMFEDGVIEPFFPLTRSGDFWLEYNKKIKGTDGKTTNEYVVEAFENDSARRRVMLELEADPNVEEGSVTPFLVSQLNKLLETFDPQTGKMLKAGKKKYDKVPPTSFVADMLRSIEKNLAGVDAEVKGAIKDDITKLFLNALPESSFMRSLQARSGDEGMGTEGFQESATQAFRLRAYDLNRQSVSIKGGEDLRQQLLKVHENIEVLRRKDGISDQNAQVIGDEWDMRVEFATNPPHGARITVARNLNRMAFLGTIGFNMSSAIVNLTQIPLMVYPYLAGKTDARTAMKHLITANKLVLSSGMGHKIETINGEIVESKGVPSIDNFYLTEADGTLSLRDDLDVDEDTKQLLRKILPLVQAAKNHGLLNRSLFYDTLGTEIGGKTKNMWDKVSAWSAFPFHTAERYNRQIALVGSFLNEMDRLKSNPLKVRNEVGLSEDARLERAVTNALNDTQLTNGGAVLPTAPRWAQQGIGRVAMMYKSFGIGMYYTQFRMWQQLFKNMPNRTNADKELLREAKRQLIGVHLSGLFLSGVSGWTLYGIVAGMANLMLLGDDEEDADTIMRKHLGELAFKGGVNELTKVMGGEGVDVATRIGLANLLVASNRYNFNPSVEKSIVKTLGGPAYGYGSQVARGIADIYAGETERGVENMLPSAFRNAWKGTPFIGRYSREGILTRRKDPIMGEVDNGLLAAQFFGFAPAEYTMNQERNQVLKRIDKAVNEDRTSLHRRYYIAMYMGDFEAMDDIEDEMVEFNDKHPTAAITSTSVRTSMKKHMETTAKMYNGVVFSPNMEDSLRLMAEDWNQGFQGL